MGLLGDLRGPVYDTYERLSKLSFLSPIIIRHLVFRGPRRGP